jgi:hypothetical protein
VGSVKPGRWFAALLVAALTLPGAAAAARSAKQIGRALEQDPVYVESGARPKVSTSDAGRIRLRIADKDIGRIKIAVVRPGTAAESGGASGLAKGIDRAIVSHGTIVVVAGSEAFALTSHPDSNETVAALRSAFNRNAKDGRTAQLLAAVDAIARVDPGPSADLNSGRGGAPGGKTPDVFDVDDDVKGVFDTVKLVFLIVGIAVALPFVLFCLWLILRYMRGRRESEESFEDQRERVRNALIALGEDIGALDVDSSMPNADPAALADYEAAVSAYDTANAELERADSPSRLAAASAALSEGRRRIDSAKLRFGRAPAPGA